MEWNLAFFLEASAVGNLNAGVNELIADLWDWVLCCTLSVWGTRHKATTSLHHRLWFGFLVFILRPKEMNVSIKEASWGRQ